jgi:hypothetical protein
MGAHDNVFMLPQLDRAFFLDSAVVGCRQWFDGDVNLCDWDRTHHIDVYASWFAASSAATAVGEKSADYLFWSPAHQRIARCLPDVKLIVILRNPVERAWSHYWNEFGKGRETLAFEEALREEDDRCRRSAYALDHLSYRTRGYYDESLHRLFAHIPAERVIVTTLEEARQDPVGVLRTLYSGVGVDPGQGMSLAGAHFNANWTTVPGTWTRLPVLSTVEKLIAGGVDWVARKLSRSGDAYRRRSVAWKPPWRATKDKLQMNPDTRAQLQEIYAPHIRRLESLLGRSFPQWQDSP